MQELELLHTKLQLLLKKQQTLKKENQRLHKIVATQQDELNNYKANLQQLEQSNMLEQLSKKILTPGEKKNMKKQIANVIQEIDKLLHTLND